MAKLIRDWDDLTGLESEDYTISVDRYVGCGYIIPKDEFSDKLTYYLSTHTFYESSYKSYEEILQMCGFDVELKSWDWDL